MEFKCINKKGKNTESWTGSIKYIRKVVHHYEMEVDARGSYFHVIFGEHSYGKYVCIPNWDVGCELSNYTDLFWNTERISKQIRSIVDAISVATAIKAVMTSKELQVG